MQPKFPLCAYLWMLALCLIGFSRILAAQPTLQEQLKAQYKTVKVGVSGAGLTVTDPGTVLDVQKGGVLAIPPQIAMFCPVKFQDNELKAPNGLCAAMVKQNSRFLQNGEKVYPMRIDVSLDKDRVSFQVVECDSCNNVQQPSFYKAEVVFQFAKGSLQSMNASQVEDTIGQVFSIDSGDSQDQGGNQGGNNQGGNNQGNNGGGNNQGAGGQQQSEPVQITIGMTPDQVKAANGNPDKIVNLGAKQIYVYKDMKITFVNGKVSDVQ